MTTTTERAKMYERIGRHGRQLLAIFPDATEQGPLNLCMKLRRIETVAHRMALNWCNGDCDQDEFDAYSSGLMVRLKKLLGSDRVWLNDDARGYALKVDLKDGETLYRDGGGCGIVAPDLTD